MLILPGVSMAMHLNQRHFIRRCAAVALVILAAMSTAQGFRSLTRTTIDPLPSWEETPVKREILTFIANAGNPAHPAYIPVEERIAVLDLDGAMLVEKPQMLQVEVALDKLRTEALADRSLADKQPWKAALENDTDYIRENKTAVLLQSVEGRSLRQYRDASRHFIRTQEHERFGVPFKETVYQPMLELSRALRDGGFTVYLVSGSKTEFLRALQEEKLTDFKRHELIGTRVAIEFDPNEPGPRFMVGDYFREPDNWLTGKAENIREYLGRGPVLAVGNSMGDYEMLTYTESSPRQSLCLVIDHDDAEREYAYEDKELIDLAKQNGWTIISMKDDWKTVLGD